MKLDIYVPSSLDDITLEQYQKFHKISDGKESNNFINQKMVEIFCNIDLKEIVKIKYTSLNKVLQHIDNLFKKKSKFKRLFVLNGVHYGFIPKLDEMTFGEYIDLDNYFSDWNTMDKAMSVLFRPITYKDKDKYLIEEYEGIKNNMKKMPLSVVMSTIIFFYSLSRDLSVNILKSLQSQKDNIQLNQTLLGNGAGINLYMELVEETLRDLTKSPISNYMNV
tara:strand:+ start:8772 stop:9434 length:663 start_codon:yes stop_codon:yes gene_type:complete